jgi:phage terminase small subunit
VGGIGNTKAVQMKRRATNTDEYGLTIKERRFCDHLIADPDQNRRKAYIQAGYSAKSMQSVDRGCYKVYRRPQVKRYLQMRRNKMRRKLELKQEDVLKELANIAMFDPADLFDEYGSLRQIQDVPENARRAIAQLDVFTEYSGRGDKREVVGHTTRIKLVDKKGALDSIARILGYFQQDKIDTDGVAKLMQMIGDTRGGSTIGRLNSTAADSSRQLPGPVVATQQPVLHPGQGGERGPLPAQLGANGITGELLVHERDPESASAGDDDVSGHTATR